MASHSFAYSAKDLFEGDSDVSACNLRCVKAEETRRGCPGEGEKFECYADHELKPGGGEGGDIQCRIRYGCQREVKE